MTRELQGKAQDHMSRNEWSEAVEVLEKAIEIDPQNPYVLNKLAFCHSRLKNHTRAVALYEQLMKLQPNDARWPYMLGYQYYDQQDYKRAVAYFDKALEINPNYLVAQYRRGYALSTMGPSRRGHALTALEKCRTIYNSLPESDEKQRELKHYSDACYQQGKLFLAVGNYEMAIKRLKEAAELRPKDAYAHYSLGKAFVANNQCAEAIPILEKAQRLAGKPEHYILDRLAQAYTGEGDLNKALQIYEEMPDHIQNRPYILRNMGELYIRLEKWDQAEKVLIEATRKDKKNHNAYFNLGQVYDRGERWSIALTAYRQAVQLRKKYQEKSFPEAENAIKVILIAHPEAEQNNDGVNLPRVAHGRNVAKVKTFNSRGFGFLETDDGDLFFHISQVQNRQEVYPGEYLEYELGTGRNGRPAAINLSIIDNN